MARLPNVGGDSGSWGYVLNAFLSISHNSDGTLKNEGLLASKYTLPNNGIPEVDLSSDVQTKLNVVTNMIDVDDTLAANSDTRLATQQATKAYVDNTVSATVAEDISLIAATGITETISWNIPMHDITLDQNCTIGFSNIMAGKSITVVVRGSFTLTWPATVKWSDLTEPDYTGPAIYTFMSTNGSEVFGFQAGYTMGTA